MAPSCSQQLKSLGDGQPNNTARWYAYRDPTKERSGGLIPAHHGCDSNTKLASRSDISGSNMCHETAECDDGRVVNGALPIRTGSNYERRKDSALYDTAEVDDGDARTVRFQQYCDERMLRVAQENARLKAAGGNLDALLQWDAARASRVRQEFPEFTSFRNLTPFLKSLKP
eukprot:scaffold61386_cov40-Prasinocladus_malaysianus.AAC.1